MSLEQLLEEIDPDEWRRRLNSYPTPTTSREFYCSECHSRCTRLTDGVREAGHTRDCSRRLQRTGAQRQAPLMADGGPEVDR